MAQGVKVEAEADRKRNRFLAEFQTTYLIDLTIIITPAHFLNIHDKRVLFKLS